MSTSKHIAMRLDPCLVMEAAGLEPDPWQVELLRGTWQKAILNVCRQGGKSTATACLALHTATFTENALVLVVSPSLRQSKELFRKCIALYGEADLDGVTPVEVQSELRVRFRNGSRIIALPGKEKTIRGFSGVDLLIEDEAARVDDEVHEAVRPMLAVSGGRMVLLSTPFGRRGHFYEAWMSGSSWHHVRVTAEECPRISEAFLEEERRSLGLWFYRQEYLCEFSDSVEQFFATSDIDRAFDGAVPPLLTREKSSVTSDPVPAIEPLALP